MSLDRQLSVPKTFLLESHPKTCPNHARLWVCTSAHVILQKCFGSAAAMHKIHCPPKKIPETGPDRRLQYFNGKGLNSYSNFKKSTHLRSISKILFVSMNFPIRPCFLEYHWFPPLSAIDIKFFVVAVAPPRFTTLLRWGGGWEIDGGWGTGASLNTFCWEAG